MRKHPARISLAAIACIALVPLAACGGDDESSDEANADVCEERAELTATVASLAPADPSTVTVGDLRDARDQIGDQLDDLSDAAADAAEAEFDEVRAAYDQYSDVVDGLSDDAPVDAAAPDVNAAAGAVVEALDRFYSAADCA
jgi:hypothetical protein